MAPPRMISTRHSHSATSDSNRHQANTKQQRLSQILDIAPSQNLQNPIGVMTRMALFFPPKHISSYLQLLNLQPWHDVHEVIPASLLSERWWHPSRFNLTLRVKAGTGWSCTAIGPNYEAQSDPFPPPVDMAATKTAHHIQD
jgi:hypothetical protein